MALNLVSSRSSWSKKDSKGWLAQSIDVPALEELSIGIRMYWIIDGIMVWVQYVDSEIKWFVSECMLFIHGHVSFSVTVREGRFTPVNSW